jgi:hypothetical protein
MRLPPILLYVLRRLAIGLVVLFGISAVAFSMAYLLPSDPVTSRYPDITNEQRAEMRRQMGLDQPLVVQYARYMQSVFRGEFGRSFGTGNSVNRYLIESMARLGGGEPEFVLLTDSGESVAQKFYRRIASPVGSRARCTSSRHSAAASGRRTAPTTHRCTRSGASRSGSRRRTSRSSGAP